MSKKTISFALVLFLTISTVIFSTAKEDKKKASTIPQFGVEVTIKPNPEEEGTFKCNVKVTDLASSVEFTGPEPTLYKGLEQRTGTAHNEASLDMFLVTKISKDCKTVEYSLDVYKAGEKVTFQKAQIILY